MKILRHLPNALTLANLVCGSLAILFIAQSFDSTLAVMLIFIAAFFDLLDGAAARKLGVHGDMGRELDSLADVVSFGLAPSIIIFGMLQQGLPTSLQPLSYLAFINVVCAALRLARFNTQEATQKTFNGMPSPANGIFWASLLAITAWNKYTNADAALEVDMVWPTNLVITMLVITSGLMVSNVQMFSFKMKPGGITANKTQYSFLATALTIAAASIVVLDSVLMAIPMLVLVYIIFSVITHVWNSK